MKKFALFLLALCAALVPVGVFASPGWAETLTYEINKADDLMNNGLCSYSQNDNGYYTLNKIENDVVLYFKSNVQLDGKLKLMTTYTGEHLVTISGDNTLLTRTGNGPAIEVDGGKVKIMGLIISGDETTGNGGGIEAGNCYLEVTNCRFEGNTSTNTEYYHGGGGIFAEDCTLTVTSCDFTSNTALNGGGICFKGSDNDYLTVENCHFYNNTSTGGVQGSDGGGGIYVASAGEVKVEDSIFTNNKVTAEGGAVYINIGEDKKATLTGCVFEVNGADQHGGGICVNSGVVEVTNCAFRDNEAKNSGGGIDASGGVGLTVINCVFSGNKAEGDTDGNYGYGGGLRFYNTNYYNETKNVIKVAQCTFTGNEAKGNSGNGGGLHIEFGNGTEGNKISGTVENCTFTGNTAKVYGDGLFMTSQSNMPTVNYCTFVDNTAGNGAEIYAASSATVTNSIIHGTYDSAPGKELTLTNCLTTANLPSTLTPALADAKVPVGTSKVNVQHTVFRKYAELYNAVGKGQAPAPTDNVDQLGNSRNGKPDKGAVQIAATKLAFKVNGAQNIPSATVGESFNQTLNLSATPADGYTYTWTVSPATSGDITASIDQKGILTFKGTPQTIGKYNFNVTATAHTGDIATADIAVTVESKPVPVTGVTMKSSTSILVGNTETLTPTVAPSDATNKKVTWKSGNEAVAKVDGNGEVTAVAPGTATITVTTVDGSKTAQCTVTVTTTSVPVTGVSLDKTTFSLKEGKSATLTATVAPSDATNQNVVWTSSNTNVATVSNGVVTAVAAGTATITVTTVDGNKTAECAVTVRSASDPTAQPNIAVGFTQTTEKITVLGKSTAEFKAEATAEYPDDNKKYPVPVVYSLSDEKLDWISIDSNGTVTADKRDKTVAPGTYTVQVIATATEDDVTEFATATLTVEIKPDPHNFLCLEFTSECPTLSLKKGETVDVLYKARAYYNDAYTIIPNIPVTLKYEPVNGDTNNVQATTKGEDSITLKVQGPEKGKSYTYKVTAHSVFPYNSENWTADAVAYTTVTGFGVDHISATAHNVYLEALETVTEAGQGVITEDLTKYVDVKNFYTDGTSGTSESKTLTFKQGENWPSWMKIDGTNVVITPPVKGSGEPVTDGKFDYSVTASDADVNQKTAGTITVVVRNPEEPHIETVVSVLPRALGMYYSNNKLRYGEHYAQTFTASGMKPITWSVVGSLPTGLELTYDANAGTATIEGDPINDEIGKDFTFTLEARNDTGADTRSYTLRVSEVGPSQWKKSERASGAQNSDFPVNFIEKKGPHLNYELLGVVNAQTSEPKELKDNAVIIKDWKNGNKRLPGAGEVYIKFDKQKDRSKHWAVMIIGENDGGKSTVTMEVYITPTGKLKVAAAADGADGENGISAVIGTTEGEYAYATLDAMLAALGDRLSEVTGLEFVSGATVDTGKIKDNLPNLTYLSVTSCDVKELNLSGSEKLTGLDVSDCPKLTELNGLCTALESVSLSNVGIEKLNLSQHMKLTSVDVTGCESLTELYVMNCTALTRLDADNCEKLKYLNLTGCTALEELSLARTSLTQLDLSSCSGLKSLGLDFVTELTSLTLPTGAALEDLTLTGSKVTNLMGLNNCTTLVSADLSDNKYLKKLDLSGCPALKELDVSRCASLTALNVGGCEKLETLKLKGCMALETLNIGETFRLRELDLTGVTKLTELDCTERALSHLDLDGMSWLKPDSLHCAGQKQNGAPMNSTLDLNQFTGGNAGRVSDVQGRAADGKLIELLSWDPETGIAVFASVPDTVSYNYRTGFRDVTMDVELALTGEPTSDGPTSNNGGGGCDAGLNGSLGACVLGLFVFAALLSSRVRTSAR